MYLYLLFVVKHKHSLFYLEHYLVQLIESTNESIKPATYLLQVHSDKITGYRTTQNDLEDVAWSWDMSTFYAYRVHKRAVQEIEIIIGKLVGNAQYCV